jgi:hypothetical protein
MFFPAHAFAKNAQMRKFQFQRLLRLLRIPEPLAICREPSLHVEHWIRKPDERNLLRNDGKIMQ